MCRCICKILYTLDLTSVVWILLEHLCKADGKSLEKAHKQFALDILWSADALMGVHWTLQKVPLSPAPAFPAERHDTAREILSNCNFPAVSQLAERFSEVLELTQEVKSSEDINTKGWFLGNARTSSVAAQLDMNSYPIRCVIWYFDVCKLPKVLGPFSPQILNPFHVSLGKRNASLELQKSYGEILTASVGAQDQNLVSSVTSLSSPNSIIT